MDKSGTLTIAEIKQRLNPKEKAVPDALWEGLFIMSMHEQELDDKKENETDKKTYKESAFHELMKKGLRTKDITKQYETLMINKAKEAEKKIE